MRLSSVIVMNGNSGKKATETFVLYVVFGHLIFHLFFERILRKGDFFRREIALDIPLSQGKNVPCVFRDA